GKGLSTTLYADSWQHPGAERANYLPDLSDPAWKSMSVETHEAPAYPARPDDWGAPTGTDACGVVPIKGNLSARPTAIDTETPTGLSVKVDVPNAGLESPEGIASSDIESVKVALPEGMTINPSQAEGLSACTEAQYQSTRLAFQSDPGHGCPDAS